MNTNKNYIETIIIQSIVIKLKTYYLKTTYKILPMITR
jgi:hypothetical protein